MTLVVQQFVSPAVAAAGLPHQPTGNMEGKEVRFGDTSKGELLAVHVASESDVAATKGSDAAMAAEAGIDVHGIARRDVGPEGIARRDVGPEG